MHILESTLTRLWLALAIDAPATIAATCPAGCWSRS